MFDLTTIATAIAVIVGFTNGVKLAQEKDKSSFILFLVALGAGLVLGFLHYFGLTVETGIIAALASSGLYKVASKIGGQ